MEKLSLRQKKIITVLLIMFFLMLMTFINYRFSTLQPGGTDFLHRWLPTRMVINGELVDVYSKEASLAIQFFRYNRPAQEGEAPGLFAYPYYTMLPFLPFSLIEDFNLSRALWMTLLEVAFLCCLFLSLYLAKLKPNMTQLTILGVFTLLNANFLQGLIDGNPAGVAFLCFMLSLFFIQKENDRIAGLFLACSTLKPQMTVVAIGFVVLWAIFQKRWKIVLYTLLGGAVLVGCSMLVYPSWLSSFLYQVTSYSGYAQPSTPKGILSRWMPIETARFIAYIASGLSVVVILYFWWKSLKGDFDTFLLAIAITFTLMPFTGITSAKSNFIAMILLVVLLIKKSEDIGVSPKWANGLMLISLVTSMIFRIQGMQSTRFYFFDFYPLPLTLLGLLLFFSIRQKQDGISEL